MARCEAWGSKTVVTPARREARRDEAATGVEGHGAIPRGARAGLHRSYAIALQHHRGRGQHFVAGVQERVRDHLLLHAQPPRWSRRARPTATCPACLCPPSSIVSSTRPPPFGPT